MVLAAAKGAPSLPNFPLSHALRSLQLIFVVGEGKVIQASRDLGKMPFPGKSILFLLDPSRTRRLHMSILAYNL